MIKNYLPMQELNIFGFNPWVGKISWRREWLPIPVLLDGEFHAQRSLVCYSPWGRKEADMTEWLLLSLFQMVKRLPTTWESRVWPLGRKDPLEKEMATHSSFLSWRIPGKGEPGGLPSMGLQRVGHNWSDLAMISRRRRRWGDNLFLLKYFSILWRCHVNKGVRGKMCGCRRWPWENPSVFISIVLDFFKMKKY